MRGLHWWTLVAGIAIGYFVLPGTVAFVRARFA